MPDGDGVALLSMSHPGSEPHPAPSGAKPTKYKIEIENIGGERKPWEWRVFIDTFEEPAVMGGDRTPAGALYEAIHYVDVDGFRQQYCFFSRPDPLGE